MRIGLNGLLGGIVMFVWGAVSWMALPWHESSLKNMPNDAAVIRAMQESKAESGVYHYPGFPVCDAKGEVTEAEQEAWVEKCRQGPWISLMVYSEQGNEPFAPRQFIVGFLLNVATAMLAAYLLSLAAPALRGYGQRVIFVTLLGLFGALISTLPDWNWYMFPAEFVIPTVLDHIMGSLLAGLVLAWRIKPLPIIDV